MPDIRLRAGSQDKETDSFSIFDLAKTVTDSLGKIMPGTQTTVNLLTLTTPALEKSKSPKAATPQSYRTRWPLYEHQQNPLLDIKANNVAQGTLNDCYFISALAAVAEHHPLTIKNMITDHGDDTYTVTFPGDRLHPLTVSAASGSDLKTNAQYKSGTWTNIIEKAHRKRNNKWSNETGGGWQPETGGQPGQSIELLTGSHCHHIALAKSDLSALHEFLQDAGSHKRVMVAGRTSNQPDIDTPSIPALKLTAGHAYSLLGYDALRRKVFLRDPRGANGDNQSPTGRFCLTLPEFKSCFQYLFVSED